MAAPKCPTCQQRRSQFEPKYQLAPVRGRDGLVHLCPQQDMGGAKAISFVAICGYMPSAPLGP